MNTLKTSNTQEQSKTADKSKSHSGLAQPTKASTDPKSTAKTPTKQPTTAKS